MRFWLTHNDPIEHAEQPEYDEDHQDQAENTSQSRGTIAAVGVITTAAAEDKDQDDHN